MTQQEQIPAPEEGQEHLLDQLQLEEGQGDREGHSSETKGWGRPETEV